MAVKLALCCDYGTGGLKATIVDSEGQNLAQVFVACETVYATPSTHEQRPEDWWTSLVNASGQLGELLKAQGRGTGDIGAIGLSGHSLGCVPVGKDGALLQTLVPIWSDGRAQAQAETFFQRTDETAWYFKTGNGFPPALYTLFKTMWLREHRPEVFDQASVILGTKDYVNFRLTGEIATDTSYASGLGAFDLERMCYDDALLAAAGLSEDLWPPVGRATDIIGTLTKDAAEALGLSTDVVVIGGGVDNACMALGANTYRSGDVFASLGSSSWLTVSDAKPLLSDAAHPYVFAHVVPGQFISATSIFSSGTTLDWSRRNLFAQHDDAARLDHAGFEARAALSPVGAKGLLLVPTLGGGTSLEGGSEVRGGFVGLSLEHDLNDMLRSTYEGVGYALRTALDALRGLTEIRGSLTVVGGGAKSGLGREVLASIMGVQVVKTAIDQDAATLGIAGLVFNATGDWTGYSRLDALHTPESVTRPVPEHAEIYGKGLSAYRKAAEDQKDAAQLLAAYRQAASAR